jgi:hypothetical protein
MFSEYRNTKSERDNPSKIRLHGPLFQRWDTVTEFLKLC